MTQQDTVTLAMRMKVNYPNIYSNTQWSSEQLNAVVSEFLRFLKDIPGEVVFSAFDEYLMSDNSRFPPKAADLYKIVMKHQNPDLELSPVEAWGMLVNTMGSSDFHFKPIETFERLPDEVKKIVGSWKILKSWSLMDVEQVNGYIKNQFIRDFKEARKEAQALGLPGAHYRQISGGNN